MLLEPHLIPATPEVVPMYEERGGRLNTDPTIGYDPLACYDHLQESRELFFSLETPLLQAYFMMLFVTGLTHVTAITSLIEISQFLAQTEATP